MNPGADRIQTEPRRSDVPAVVHQRSGAEMPGGDQPRLYVVLQGHLVEFSPRNGLIRVGRGEHCEVRVDDPAVSRVHLVLTWDGRSWIVTDQSRNGTYQRDGERLRGSLPVTGPVDLLLSGPQGRLVEVGIIDSDRWRESKLR